MELWIKIRDNPNYSVSSNGRVRNNRNGKILKNRKGSNGYLRVFIKDINYNKQKDKQIHRLVVDSFFDGNHEGLDVNHIDGNKQNNFIGNLELCTRSENITHAYRTGLHKRPNTPSKAIRIIETGEVFDGIRECARYLNCSHGNISQCLNGKQSTVKGFHFEFI